MDQAHQQGPTTSQPRSGLLSRRARKLGYWVLGLVLFYTAAGFWILPAVIRSVAVKQLAKELGREVSIRQVKLNPYSFSATIRGLLIKDKDGQPFVSWDEVYVNLQASSFFGPAWVLDEVSVSKPFVRVRVNADYTFNFSDLVTRYSPNPAPVAKAPAKPFALRIDKVRIAGASANLTDLTPHTPFQRVLGPIDVSLVHFQTDPDNKNPYSVSGTTDAGEKFSWSGFFYLSPLRSEGDFSLENLSLNKYAALYQDFVRFQIRDGVVEVHSSYRFELSPTNQMAVVTNTSFSLRSLQVAEAAGGPALAEVSEFAVKGVGLDVMGRRAEVDSVSASGGRLVLKRAKDSSVNVVELAKPAAGAPQASEAVLLLLRGITNAVALFLNSTNAWSGTVHDVQVRDCALSLEDLVNSRPVRLELDQIGFSAKHISNLPGTNLTASLSLRWNTNGMIQTDVEASFSPLAVNLKIGLDRLELRPLDAYLENKLNLFVLGSKLSLDSRVRLRAAPGAKLPEITLQGDARLEDFSTVDGVWGEDLLKWRAVRVSGIEATLTPPTVAIREVAIDDAYARVVIETNRTINLMAALRMESPNAPATETAQAETVKAQPPANPALTDAPALSEPPKISIASVVISNASMQFSDRSISPPVNVGLEQASGTITGLSTEALGHAAIDLRARVDKFGPVEITGLINPLARDQTNELKVVVRNVDLTPTSPYVGKFAGYQLAQGKVEMELAYHLKGRQLKAENVIVLDRFTFGEKVNSPEATKLPVRLAIAILKDRQGKIRLDVPIEGSLDDPQFRLHKVIVGALMNLLAKVATSPFSLLGSLFGGKGEEIRYQDFAAGSAEMQPDSKDKLDSLVKGLYDRPGLQLEIQGSADPAADRDALRQAMFEKNLRVVKWHALPAAQREEVKPEQLAVTAEERPRLIRELYSQAVERGEAPALTATTNAMVAPGGEAAITPAAAGPAVPTAANRMRFSAVAHGAAGLMKPEPFPRSVPKPPLFRSPAQNLAAAPISVADGQEMEAKLVGNISVAESDLQALATQRAQAVRDYILGTGKVEAPRLFFAENPAEGGKPRVYLQLR